MRSCSGIDGHDRCADHGLDFASKEVTIVSRSCSDHAAIVVLVHPPSAIRWRSSK